MNTLTFVAGSYALMACWFFGFITAVAFDPKWKKHEHSKAMIFVSVLSLAAAWPLVFFLKSKKR